MWRKFANATLCALERIFKTFVGICLKDGYQMHSEFA